MVETTVSILCFNQVETTKRCIEALIRHTDLDRTAFILTDNGSSDGTREYLESLNLPHSIVLIYDKNVGFGAGHNAAFIGAAGIYFVALNNDVIIRENGWLTKLTDPLGYENVALVGISGAPCSLDKSGDGYREGSLEYIDGACVAGRIETLKRYGLFSSAFPMFSFEDSDLSLRYRQIGFEIRTVRIQHDHPRGVSRAGIPKPKRIEITERNRAVFLKRWSGYLTSRKFSNRILLRIPSWGIGDVIATTPVIAALRRDHPTAQIHVETLHPDVFVCDPDVETGRGKGNDDGTYDRIISLDPNYAGPKPIVHECAEIAATTITDPTPRLYIGAKDKEWAQETLAPFLDRSLIVVCHFGLHCADTWHGRNWPLQNAWDFVNRLRLEWANSICIVEVGKDIESTGRAHLNLIDKTTIRQLFAVVARSDLVVGIDSVVSHAARAFQKRSVLLFGATDPDSRVLDRDLETVVQRDDMDCLGCYQRKANPDVNTCERDECVCMDISGNHVFNVANRELRRVT